MKSKIFKREKEVRNSKILLECKQSAMRYSDKLKAAIDILLEFDEKLVDDIKEVKDSYERTGTPCILLTTEGGYQCLLDKDGDLLASNILGT